MGFASLTIETLVDAIAVRPTRPRGVSLPSVMPSTLPFPEHGQQDDSNCVEKSGCTGARLSSACRLQGNGGQIAALTVEIFARVLERCGVRFEVLGFTTRDWDGGEPAREWAARGYPENPGHLNAQEHIVVKAADVP